MAELPAGTTVDVEQPGWIKDVAVMFGPAGPDGRGIVSIIRTSGTGAAGTVDTYTITYTDATTSTFQVTNGANGAAGRGIVSIARTSGDGSPGTTDTYTITYTSGSPSTFDIYNGADGAGDMTGPASSVDDRIAVFDGLTGKVVKVGGKTIAELQPIDGDLTAIAALVSAANKMPYATGAGTWTLADLTAFARTFLDDTDAATARATLIAAASTGGGREKVAALSATTGTCTGDLDAASVFTITPSGNWTLAFSNVPATGTACTVTVIISEGGTARTMADPSGTTWAEGGAPSVTINKWRMVTLVTVDGGTSWRATYVKQA